MPRAYVGLELCAFVQRVVLCIYILDVWESLPGNVVCISAFRLGLFVYFLRGGGSFFSVFFRFLRGGGEVG